MYESFFELEGRPFLASPIAERYYPAASIEHARKSALRCIERGGGSTAILGSAGTGKSTLCQVLAKQMQDQFQIAMLTSARLCTRRALLQNILFELKQPYRDREEGELRLSLIDYLEPSETCPNGILLLVDEAHMLPLRLLEELRMLTNLVRDGQPRVRLVLAASLSLDERLASPRLESLNQRIAARCYLHSMNRDETFGYVRAQLSAVGGDPARVLTEDALQAIHGATDGIPRLVNQLCDHVLVMAAIGRRAPVEGRGVEEAWADLQQLPTPWASDDAARQSTTEGGHILEFGELDEAVRGELDSDEAPSANDEITEPQVTGQLDQIESGVAALADDEPISDSPSNEKKEPEQFRPAGNQSPEIELIFHHAHDPFNESFDDEEVIVDPFSSMDPGSTPPTAPRTQQENRPTIPFHSTDQPVEEPSGTEDSGGPSKEPAEQKPELIAESLSQAELPGSLPGDDRDLLEIEAAWDELSSENGGPANALPRRRAYRQLFANLRRG